MLLIIGFVLLIVTILLIHYTPDGNKVLTRLSLVFMFLTTAFIMFGLIQTCNTTHPNERRREAIEQRAFYVMALEDWKTMNGFLKLGKEITNFNTSVIRANGYSNSIFAPLIKGLLYQPAYVGLEPILIGEEI